jgi:hypothetical protein
MASVKLLVKKHNVSKRDGKTPVYVQYNYSRDKRILINTLLFLSEVYEIPQP